jgi:hypothetical protein
MTGPRKGLRNQPTPIAFGCETVVRQIKYFAWKLSTLCGRPENGRTGRTDTPILSNTPKYWTLHSECYRGVLFATFDAFPQIWLGLTLPTSVNGNATFYKTAPQQLDPAPIHSQIVESDKRLRPHVQMLFVGINQQFEIVRETQQVAATGDIRIPKSSTVERSARQFDRYGSDQRPGRLTQWFSQTDWLHKIETIIGHARHAV